MSAPSRLAAQTDAPEPPGTLFRLMAEQWPGAVVLCDAALQVMWANAAAVDLIGGGRAVAGAAWSELGLPWAVGAEQTRALLDGTPLTLPAAAHPASGGAGQMLRARLIPLQAGALRPNAVLCVIDEVQERPAGSDAAHAEDTQRHHALTSAQVGSWHWDFEVRFFAVDSQWCRAMNVPPCTGPDHLEQWAREIHPDDVAEFRRKCADVESGRANRFEAEYRILTADSRWLWVLQRGRVTEHRPDGRALRVTGICIEIDDRKRAEVALQENESRLATALWGAQAAFWQWQVATDVATMSPMWFAMTGYTREQWESVPHPWISRIHPDDRVHVTEVIEQHLKGRTQSIEVEYRVRTARGEWKWMLMRGRVVEWDFDGNPTVAIGVSLDVDAQKRAVLELRSSEARLETAVWGAGMGLWEMDFRTGTTRWFSDWCDRLNLDPCDGKDHVARWDSLIHPDDVAEAARRFADHVAGKADYYDAEYRIRDRAGRWRWLFERGRVVERTAEGEPLRMVGVCMDVDERKEAELESQRSQRRLEAALASARGGMWDWNLETGEVVRSGNFYRMLGFGSGEGHAHYEFWRGRVHPDDAARVLALVDAIVAGRTDEYEAEYRLRHADGGWRWVLDRARIPERDQQGRARRMVGFTVDITDWVQTQEALRQSEFRYRTVATLAPGYIFEYRVGPHGMMRPVWVSGGIEAVFGCSFEELERRGGWERFIDPGWRPVVAARQKRTQAGEPQSGEMLVHAITGESKWVHVSAMPIRDPQTGAVVGVIGSTHDITARKLAEQALRESEGLLRAVTENTPDWLVLIDPDLRVRFLNRPFQGNEPAKVLGRSVLDFVPEEFQPQFQEVFRRVLQTGKPDRLDVEKTLPSGETIYLEERMVPVLDGGRVRAVTLALANVTERKRAEAALRASEAVLRTVAGSSADWFALFDSQRRCLFTNRGIRGEPAEAWLGRPVEEFAPPHDAERVRGIFERVLATGEPHDFEQRFVDHRGAMRYFEARVRAVVTDGRIHGAVVNITDVGERYAQQSMVRTQARILETMREGVVLVDDENRIRLTNPAFDAMFGYPGGQLLGQPADPLLAVTDAQRARLFRDARHGAKTGESKTLEFECMRRDGSRFVAFCVITPLPIGDSQHWLAVLNDITERKRLEREIIEIANREQQRIGSDLHDGLGQDLTGIALMLRGVAAQLRKEGSATRLDVEDVIGLVNGAIESTRALARGLSPVSAEQGGLPAALQTLAAKAGDRYGIRVSFHSTLSGPLPLPETAATHLYRIAQEALTNVIRHSRATEVAIHLGTAGGELHLRIEDNGRGFGSAHEEINGLGLKIMRYRAQMLGGDILLESGPNGGAAVRCACPLGAEPSEAAMAESPRAAH